MRTSARSITHLTATYLTATHLAAAIAAGSALLGPAAVAVAGPDTDERGFVGSAARCDTPEAVVEFGSTATSRVAICETPDGRYQYRGVREHDGARLVAPATESGGVVFVAEHNGITYTVSSSSLTISRAGKVIRTEPMVDFHRPGRQAGPTAPDG